MITINVTIYNNQLMKGRTMKNFKRIIALLCIIILLALYVLTFIFAITDNSSSMAMFKGCVACTIFVPVAGWFFLRLHDYAMRRSGRKDSTDTSNKSE